MAHEFIARNGLIALDDTTISGSLNVTSGITGSLLGTASYAETASYVETSQTASYVLNAISSSYAITASYVLNVVSSSHATTASYVLQAVSASYALTSSYSDTSTSASYALTASYVLNAVSASYATTSSYSSYADTASYASTTTQTDINVLNQTGFNIAKGTVVRITGSNNAGDIPRITTASYDIDKNSANTLGITTQAIANGYQGAVITEGVLTGIDTSNFVSGQLIYLGATGSIIGTAPLAPLHAVRLGEVIRQQPINGSIYVRIDNGYELGELHDVLDTTTTSSYGDLLIKSGSIWISSKILTGSYILSGSLTTNDGITAVTVNATSFTGSLSGTASYATTASYVTGSIFTNSNIAASASYSVTSSYSLESISSSYAATASYAPAYLPLTGGTINGNVTLNGTASITYLNVQYETASVIYSTGSNQFGDAANDTQTLYGTVNIPTGSLVVSGSATITGSLNVTSGITGSLSGTATSASYATTASYVATAQTASYVLNAVSSSYATTASYVLNAVSASYALTSSYSNTSTSASYALTASYVLNAISSSYATTASYVLQAVSSSYATTASYVLQAVSSSYATTASYVTGSIHTSTNPALSASYALTSSYSNTSTSASYATTASYVASISPRTVTVASTLTASVNCDITDVYTITGQSASLYMGSITGAPVNGQKIIFRIKDNGTARSISYTSSFRDSADLASPTTTVISKTLYLGYIYNSTDTKWDLLAYLNNFT